MFNQLLGRKETDDRLAGTLGVAAHAMLEGVDILRVHDVEAHTDLLTTLATLRPELDS
jgi:dihydropteroate synthase